MPLISIVVPCYNEQESLPLFANELAEVVRQMASRHKDIAFEAVLVDDGSSDSTLDACKQLAMRSDLPFSIRYVSFSRNFGKEAAIYAGLEHASGDYVSIMDADLQDPPSLLPAMYDAVTQEGFDCAAARRTTRKGEPPIRSFFARMFYRLINKLSKTEVADGARDFRLMKRCVVDAVLSLGEYNRFSKGIFGWVGFRTKWIPYENVNRAAGESKWSFFSLLLYSIDGIVAFSTKPLSLASGCGIVLCVVAVAFMLHIVVRTLLYGDPVAGWPSLACIILFVGGLQLLCMGVFGQYLAKTYLETKRRPIYLVRETNISSQLDKRGGAAHQD